MTASLPLPDDQMPETEGESGAESVRETTDSPRPVRSPRAAAKDPATASAPRRPARPKTSAPRTSSAASAGTAKRAPRAAASEAKTVAKPAAPRKPRAPRASKPAPPVPAEQTATPAVDPGPPPPIPEHIVVPSGLVIPPRPPLPPVASSTDDVVAEGEAATIEPDVEVESIVVEPEPEPVVVLAEPELETAVESEPAAVAPEPVVVVAEPEPEPETLVESGPAAVDPEPVVVVEPDPVVVVEPDPVAVEAETVEPEAEQVEADAAPVDLEVVAIEEPEAVETVERVEPEVEVEPTDLIASEPETETIDDDSTADGALALVVTERDDAIEPDADAPAPALRLRGVTKRFGETLAVDAIDLTVPAGSFYGLVGPNGAGKTTTLSMIAGLLRPDGGEISVGGIDSVKRASEAKRRMGVLPDRLRTFDRLTGRQLLYYYGVLRGLPSAVVESRTNDLARAFELADALGRSVSDYSAGMTKKVMLAGAMIHSPRLLVLDEPFESVDPVSSAVILDILTTYVEHGGTVILSSHGMDLVERVCSGVAVLVAGHVLAEGTVDEVRGELSLEERFLELAGGSGDLEGLEWLHTFSD